MILGGNSPQDESVGQKRVEATSENNAASNHSSGCLANIQRNKEQTEKGSDAQVSALHLSYKLCFVIDQCISVIDHWSYTFTVPSCTNLLFPVWWLFFCVYGPIKLI